ncbi:MAG: saccharopine dehydrogenase NADP-binding domain-containing protein [Gemmatimonadetes bacterium]|nr:saccharopine dehydrogenase NADP-binding domain-containing protein [Gemmatimonadota bacterium]
MRFLVLGAGLQGSACTFDLLGQDDVDGVTVADRRPDLLAGYVPEDPRLERIEADFGDHRAIAELMQPYDVVLSAAPYYFNGPLAAAAVEAGCHFGDLGGNSEIARRQIELDARAREAGRAIMPELGLAPGMINILAADGIRRLDRADSVRMYVGGLPQHPVPPLNYQVVYSLEGMLDYVTTPSVVLRDGAITEVVALSELESIEFADIGTLEAFHTAGGASLLPWEHEDRIPELAYKTLRYPGHARLLRAIRDLGLVDDDAIDVKGQSVVPRDAFIACVTPKLRRPGEPDLVALRVIAEGERGGEATTITYDVVDRADEATGVSAMERTTGYTLSIAGLFMGRGAVAAGAAPAYRTMPFDPYVEELARRGIRVDVSEE